MSSAERSEFLPDVPTLSEIVPQGLEATNRLALLAPPGMDKALADRITEAAHKALATDAVTAAYTPLGYVAAPLGPVG